MSENQWPRHACVVDVTVEGERFRFDGSCGAGAGGFPTSAAVWQAVAEHLGRGPAVAAEFAELAEALDGNLSIEQADVTPHPHRNAAALIVGRRKK